MGVKTEISLAELNTLFVSYNFTKIIPTSNGIIDTTYIVQTKTASYILKKYERDIKEKIQEDIKLLTKLNSFGLNVPSFIEQSGEWFLYEKLKGSEPKVIKTFHIQALGRFLARFHSLTYKKTCNSSFMQNYEIPKLLNSIKNKHYVYYKKLQYLKKYDLIDDGLIHGDIFKDNTVFENEKIGVFDFIDSACGNFVFECGVALVGFGVFKNNYFINSFLRTYNQKAPKKISKKELLLQIDMACGFYALLRIDAHKNTKKAKELL